MWHFTELPSLAAATQDDAVAFANEVLRVAHDDRLRYRVVVPLSGIEVGDAEDGIVADGAINIRSLSGVEQAEYFETTTN
jgi:hypothetical protein